MSCSTVEKSFVVTVYRYRKINSGVNNYDENCSSRSYDMTVCVVVLLFYFSRRVLILIGFYSGMSAPPFTFSPLSFINVYAKSRSSIRV